MNQAYCRQLNQKINKIKERSLRIIYKDTESTFSELLQKDCAVIIRTKNLQILTTDMYKTKYELNPLFMQEIFRENTTRYNLRNNNEFTQPKVRSVSNRTESVRFNGPQLWQTLPSTIRNLETLCQLKKRNLVRRKLSLEIMLHLYSKLGLFIMIAFRYAFLILYFDDL